MDYRSSKMIESFRGHGEQLPRCGNWTIGLGVFRKSKGTLLGGAANTDNPMKTKEVVNIIRLPFFFVK